MTGRGVAATLRRWLHQRRVSPWVRLVITNDAAVIDGDSDHTSPPTYSHAPTHTLQPHGPSLRATPLPGPSGSKPDPCGHGGRQRSCARTERYKRSDEWRASASTRGASAKHSCDEWRASASTRGPGARHGSGLHAANSSNGRPAAASCDHWERVQVLDGATALGGSILAKTDRAAHQSG